MFRFLTFAVFCIGVIADVNNFEIRHSIELGSDDAADIKVNEVREVVENELTDLICTGYDETVEDCSIEVYKTAISIKNGVMDGDARFVIKLKGFEGNKDDLKTQYKEEVLPDMISTPSPTTTQSSNTTITSPPDATTENYPETTTPMTTSTTILTTTIKSTSTTTKSSTTSTTIPTSTSNTTPTTTSTRTTTTTRTESTTESTTASTTTAATTTKATTTTSSTTSTSTTEYSPEPTPQPTTGPMAETTTPVSFQFPDSPIIKDSFALQEGQESELEEFKYIKPDTLDPKNFVICDDECVDEGFWALIAFGAGGGLAMIFFIVGLCASKRVQITLGTISTILLLGLIGGYLYVGIVGYLGWEYAGGCAGGAGALIIIINGGICMRSKRSSTSSVKVTEKDVDKYWDNMKEEYQETSVKLE